MEEVQRWGRSKGRGGLKVGDLKQQDWKTNEVDSMTILWARFTKAGLAWPRGEINNGYQDRQRLGNNGLGRD